MIQILTKLLSLLNDVCKWAGSNCLVDIGMCKIYKVHYAFGEALKASQWDCDSIIIDLYQWFKLSAARRKDFRNREVT